MTEKERNFKLSSKIKIFLNNFLLYLILIHIFDIIYINVNNIKEISLNRMQMTTLCFV